MIQHQSLPDVVEDDFEDDSINNDVEENQKEEWMIAAAMGPMFVSGEETEMYLREFDTLHNWNEALQRYPNIDIERNFIHTNLRSIMEHESETINSSTVVPFESLSTEQRIAHNVIFKAISKGKSIRMIICGGAGIGKSTLVNAIVRIIVNHF